MRTAIVTTLRNAEATLAYFINYHASIGFDHFFLFFDDPHDPLYDQYAAHPAITAVRHDDTLRRQWRLGRMAAENYAFVAREVMARQIMNTEVAASMAFDMGIDWLLHIDADELFYLPHGSVRTHFEHLADQGIAVAQYLNHEAIPERTDIVNFFTDVSLFKRNRSTLNAEQLELIRKHPSLTSPYFLFYDNGKSAAAVTRNTLPMGVHSFEPGGIRITGPDSPCILHFPCCGFSHFIRKYETLGQFANKWFNRGDDIAAISPVHILSRETVGTGDESIARQFYDNTFTNRHEEYKELCLEKGIFFRLHLPSVAEHSQSQVIDYAVESSLS